MAEFVCKSKWKDNTHNWRHPASMSNRVTKLYLVCQPHISAVQSTFCVCPENFAYSFNGVPPNKHSGHSTLVESVVYHLGNSDFKKYDIFFFLRNCIVVLYSVVYSHCLHAQHSNDNGVITRLYYIWSTVDKDIANRKS